MACPALPTCGLAVAESERAIPALLDQFEAELEGLGLRDAPLTIRMTGARTGAPAPTPQTWRSSDARSTSTTCTWAAAWPATGWWTSTGRTCRPTSCSPPFGPCCSDGPPSGPRDEGLGDFYQRLMGLRATRTVVTGRELPTIDLLPLEVAR
jgi:Sulfite reductase, beta subunit (hemoprotein)